MRHVSAAVWLFSTVVGAAALAAQPAAAPVSNTQSNRGAQLERMRQSFASGRELLLAKGVPFDPDQLLEPHWERKLENVFANMPEMKRVLYLGGSLGGAYIADTVYLAEKVKLAGTTVILTRHLVFEGTSPAMIGNHDLHVFPMTPTVVLGTSLRETLHKAGFDVIPGEGPLPSFSLIEPKITTLHHARIGVDVSGPSAPAKPH